MIKAYLVLSTHENVAYRDCEIFVHHQDVEELSKHIMMRPHLEGSIHEQLLAVWK
jgi:hypothetical protein